MLGPSEKAQRSSSRSKVSVGPDAPFESRNCRLLRVQSLCGEELTGGQWGGAVGNGFSGIIGGAPGHSQNLARIRSQHF